MKYHTCSFHFDAKESLPKTPQLYDLLLQAEWSWQKLQQKPYTYPSFLLLLGLAVAVCRRRLLTGDAAGTGETVDTGHAVRGHLTTYTTSICACNTSSHTLWLAPRVPSSTSTTISPLHDIVYLSYLHSAIHSYKLEQHLDHMWG